MEKEKCEVDSRFDKIEKTWDRLQKLLLKIVGGVVGIVLTFYIAYGQLKEKHEEHFTNEKIEGEGEIIKNKLIDSTQSHNNKYYESHDPKQENDEKSQLIILSRLQSDCEYFLGNGNGNDTNLYNSNISEHIKAMKDLWIGLNSKPEWLGMKDIMDYERKMNSFVPVVNTVKSDTITEPIPFTTAEPIPFTTAEPIKKDTVGINSIVDTVKVDTVTEPIKKDTIKITLNVRVVDTVIENIIKSDTVKSDTIK